MLSTRLAGWPAQSRYRRILAAALCLMVAALVTLDWLFPLNLPVNRNTFARVVVDEYGEPLRAFPDAQGIWRYEVGIDEVSPHYLTALLQYEDRWFYWHPGVNPFSLFRAAWQNLTSGKTISGGSTLTMQVARLLHTQERSLSGKTIQILRAIQLEWHLSKKDIIELYLNHAPFGGTREGVQAASYQYLGKPANSLTRSEAALLAILPQAPSRLRPDRYPARAQIARNKLLHRMKEFGVWTEEQVKEALKEKVAVFAPQQPMLAPLLARRLVRDHPGRKLIRTTINHDLQASLQQLASDYANHLPRGSSVAILVVDNDSHQVKAYIGSADFRSAHSFGHVDMVTAIRSPGSTLKPFLYGMAMDAGLIHSASLLADVPRQFSSYQPANFNRGFVGPVRADHALKYSLNVPAVELLEHYGPARFANKLANAGLRLHLPATASPNLSVILGGTGLSLEQLVQTYGSFGQNGLVHSLQYLALTDQPANRQINPRYLMSPGSAWVVRHILQSIPRPDRVNSNLARSNASDIAWKSGTSYGYRDAWAVGINPDVTIGVWVGRPDGTPQPGHYGALSAAPLMFSAFDLLGRPSTAFEVKPDSVDLIDICWPLGTAKSEQSDNHCHVTHQAWTIDGNIPLTLPQLSENSDWIENPATYWVNRKTGKLVDAQCSADFRSRRQVALWPKILEPWIERRFRRTAQVPAYDSTCPNPIGTNLGTLRIVGISDRSLLRAAGTSTQSPVVNATVIGAQGRKGWYLNGEKINHDEDTSSISLEIGEAGNYQIVVIDEIGKSAKVDFRVLN